MFYYDGTFPKPSQLILTNMKLTLLAALLSVSLSLANAAKSEHHQTSEADDFHDIFSVLASEENGRVILAPCSSPASDWVAVFKKPEDEAKVRALIKKLPPRSPHHSRANFWLRVAADSPEIKESSRNFPSDRFVVYRIDNIVENDSCFLMDYLDAVSKNAQPRKP